MVRRRLEIATNKYYQKLKLKSKGINWIIKFNHIKIKRIIRIISRISW